MIHWKLYASTFSCIKLKMNYYYPVIILNYYYAILSVIILELLGYEVQKRLLKH